MRDILKLIWNCVSIVWYNMEIQVLKVVSWVEDYHRDMKRAVDYLDNPRYIKSDYDDDYDVTDYVPDHFEKPSKPKFVPYDGPVCKTP